jgi:hypothetical protein
MNIPKGTVKVVVYITLLLVFGILAFVGTFGAVMTGAAERAITGIQRISSHVRRW